MQRQRDPGAATPQKRGQTKGVAGAFRKGDRTVTTADETFLAQQEGDLLLQLARRTLEAWVEEGRLLSLEGLDLPERLREKRGAFVTLRRGPFLRGCVGYTANIKPLAEAVRDNTINAAFRDSRFDPVKAGELPEITIEISALTPGDSPESPMRAVHSIDEIVIGRDGVCIEGDDQKGGLLLPQVATEHGWSTEEFLDAVCHKAGYPPGAWRDPAYRVYRFSAQVFSESGRQN